MFVVLKILHLNRREIRSIAPIRINTYIILNIITLLPTKEAIILVVKRPIPPQLIAPNKTKRKLNIIILTLNIKPCENLFDFLLIIDN